MEFILTLAVVSGKEQAHNMEVKMILVYVGGASAVNEAKVCGKT